MESNIDFVIHQIVFSVLFYMADMLETIFTCAF